MADRFFNFVVPAHCSRAFKLKPEKVFAGIGKRAKCALTFHFAFHLIDNNLEVRLLIMPGDVTFATNSSDIEPRFYEVLNDVSDVLNQYPATYVDVIGHADSRGAADYNQRLSERRAQSVAGYLIAQRVLRDRFYVAGLGETSPIASNDTAEGRALNRRVEIRIRPHVAS